MHTRLADIFDGQHEAKFLLLRRLRQQDEHHGVLIDELLNVVAAHYAVLEEVVLPALPPDLEHIASVMDSQRSIVAGISDLLSVRSDPTRQEPALDVLEAQINHQRALEGRHLLPALALHLSAGQEAICCAEAEATIERRVGLSISGRR